MKIKSSMLLLTGLVSLLGWVNPCGRHVYAQYGCSLHCTATVPTTGRVGEPIAMSGSASGSYCTGAPSFSWSFGQGSAGSSQPSPTYTYTAAGTYTWSMNVTLDDAACSQSGTITIAPRTNPVATVSAASFSGTGIASESIVAAFGTGLATTTQLASALPLPTDLAGTRVEVKDSAGATRLAPLFFVSAGQVNYLVPPGTVNGTATVTVTSGNGTVSGGNLQIETVAPGLFTFTGDGQGVPAGYLLRFRNGQQQPDEQVYQLNAQNQIVPRPIDLGPDTDLVFLILYGTSIRHRSSLAGVTLTIGGVNAQVDYADPQGGFVGLDQVNVRLPRALAGRGEVTLVLTVDGKAANTVKLNIQ